MAIEAIPGWDIFPFELDGLRIKPLEPLADAEPPREGEDPADCFCQSPLADDRAARIAWRNERWILVTLTMNLPLGLILRPVDHHDIADLPDDLASEMGLLMVAITAGARGSTPRPRRARQRPTRREVRRHRPDLVRVTS